MSFIHFVENIVPGKVKMKNLKYTKEDCTLCRGLKEIIISKNDLVVCMCGEIVTCPFCEGKGHLNILKTEE